jgi:hypothetical protein
MKQKRLLVATVVFLLIINTCSLWEGQLGGFHLLLSIFLFFYFLVLAGFLVGQLFAAFNEKLKDKRRLYLLAVLVFTLVSTVLYPSGMINFDNWGSPTVLIAQMEGAANCTTTLKLKKDNTFVERVICFGITDSKGRYHLKGDTIFFHSVESGRNNGNFYKYAVLKRPEVKSKNNLGDLECYERLTDSIGLPMMIIKDKLIGLH